MLLVPTSSRSCRVLMYFSLIKQKWYIKINPPVLFVRHWKIQQCIQVPRYVLLMFWCILNCISTRFLHRICTTSELSWYYTISSIFFWTPTSILSPQKKTYIWTRSTISSKIIHFLLEPSLVVTLTTICRIVETTYRETAQYVIMELIWIIISGTFSIDKYRKFI